MLYNFEHFWHSKNKSLGKETWQGADRINFFVKHFYELSRSNQRTPLGQYLKAANLLNELQIEIILAEQKQVDLLFGEIAIKKGYVDSETIDFFLEIMIIVNN